MVFSWNSSKISKIRTKLTFEFLSKKKLLNQKIKGMYIRLKNNIRNSQKKIFYLIFKYGIGGLLV